MRLIDFPMTREEAIRILDPETTVEALAEIEYYHGLNGATAKVNAVSDACILAVAALRELEEREETLTLDELQEKAENVPGWAEHLSSRFMKVE